jgi:formate hydrogenlyase subunit 3/multisubunit Na+/H+ antiporter MnhD subunit
MVSKDQGIGGAILIVCVVVAIGYLVTLFYPTWLSTIGLIANTAEAKQNAQFWTIAVPVFIAFVAILFIGAWIGWTMATTPPPKPIEEITTEIEEKKEEPKVEEPVAVPETAATEEKPAAKKKK